MVCSSKETVQDGASNELEVSKFSTGPVAFRFPRNLKRVTGPLKAVLTCANITAYFKFVRKYAYMPRYLRRSRSILDMYPPICTAVLLSMFDVWSK